MKITEYLAIYAAFLSTVVFAWNMHRAVPRFKVELIFGTKKINDEYVSGAYISVQNPSNHTIHLSNISILYPYKKVNILELITHLIKYRRIPLNIGWVYSSLSNYDINDGCPVALEPGKSHEILFPSSTLEEVFKKSKERIIKASVQDQLWRTVHSRKFELP